MKNLIFEKQAHGYRVRRAQYVDGKQSFVCVGSIKRLHSKSDKYSVQLSLFSSESQTYYSSFHNTNSSIRDLKAAFDQIKSPFGFFQTAEISQEERADIESFLLNINSLEIREQEIDAFAAYAKDLLNDLKAFQKGSKVGKYSPKSKDESLMKQSFKQPRIIQQLK